MTEIKHYGVSTEENTASNTQKCRQIVKTLLQFGVSEQEKLKIIFLLSLELENHDYLQEISSLVKRLEDGEQRSTLIKEV